MAIHFYKTSTPRTRRKFLFDFDFNPNRRGTMARYNRRSFEDFDSEDLKAYRNRFLIGVLEVILNEKGVLTPADIPRAKEQCMSLIQQDIEFLANKQCLYKNSGDPSLDPSKCCLMQLKEGKDLYQDAVELVHRMEPSLLMLFSNQPKDKRLKIRNYLRIICHMRSEVDITSGDISTFPGLFELLIDAVNAIDEEINVKYYKLKPHFESLLRELGPKIVLKIKKYYKNSRLGHDECKFCNSHWVQEENEWDITNLSKLACFKTPAELEKFLVLSFRRMFYAELLKLINENFRIDEFSDDGF